MNLAQEIKRQIDIVDFINKYVGLKKSGNNYTGLCPFHSEKTPSFVVNKEKQFFHCFGCGESGDVITFYMKIENLSFKEALRSLAKELGININYENEDTKKSHQLEEIHQYATEFFQKKLRDSKFAQEYLEKRQINKNTIEEFRLGYNPNDNSLADFLLKKFSPKLLNESGILSNSYNIFAGRLIFPINNEYGDTVGFAGRAMHDNQKAKYLNTKETLIFSKQKILYGYEKSKANAKEYLIICEGYFDCIRLHQEGLKQAVATMGTNLSDYHIRLIRRLTDKIYFNFDTDKAGINAMLKNTKVLGQLDAYVIEFNTNIASKEDPDSFVSKHSIEEYKKLLSVSKDYFTFLEEKIIEQYNLQNTQFIESKPLNIANAINTIKNTIDGINDQILKSLYYSKARKLLNLNIHQKIDKTVSKLKKTYSKSDYILSYLLKDSYLANWIEDKEDFAKIFNDIQKNIYFKIITLNNYTFDQLIDSLDDESKSISYELYLLTPEQTISQKRENFLMLMNSIEIDKLKKQMQTCLKGLANNTNNEALKDLYRKTKEKLQRLKNE